MIVAGLVALACGLGACYFIHSDVATALNGFRKTGVRCGRPISEGDDDGSARNRKIFALLLSVLGCGLAMFLVISLSA